MPAEVRQLTRWVSSSGSSNSLSSRVSWDIAKRGSCNTCELSREAGSVGLLLTAPSPGADVPRAYDTWGTTTPAVFLVSVEDDGVGGETSKSISMSSGFDAAAFGGACTKEVWAEIDGNTRLGFGGGAVRDFDAPGDRLVSGTSELTLSECFDLVEDVFIDKVVEVPPVVPTTVPITVPVPVPKGVAMVCVEDSLCRTRRGRGVESGSPDK